MPVAHLADDGVTMTAQLRITCQLAPLGVMWEGSANAEQGDVRGGSELLLICDGRPHVQNVVFDLDGSGLLFERGEAP